jgi:hypothetical protein
MSPANPARRLRRVGVLIALTASTALLFSVLAAAPAMAEFGLNNFDVTFSEGDATPGNPFDDPPATQAGSHPFAITTTFGVNHEGNFPDAEVKDAIFEQIPGFIGDATAMPRCKTADFVAIPETLPECPNDTAVGISASEASVPHLFFDAPVYNLQPPPGVVARLGFVVLKEPVIIDVGIKQGGDYNLTASSIDVSQAQKVFGSTLQIWGNPADPAHDFIRGQCAGAGVTFGEVGEIDFGAGSTGSCPSNVKAPKPFLTLPRSCTGPTTSAFEADSWSNPGVWVSGSALTHDNAIPPKPQGFTGCSKLGFNPTIAAKPTTRAAGSPTGLDFSLNVHDEGLTNPTGLAGADIKKAVVTLPEGFSTNPSLAEGLNVCTEADLERETVNSEPGSGCPAESKIGTVEVETPLLEEPVNGALFIAKPYENPSHSLLALYIVIRNPKLGIVVKQALKVEPDPLTGQLTTIAEDLPQLPFSHFNLHFREGTRSPLASPPACGTYSAKALLTPSSGTEPITTTSAFSIISGADNSPCPSADTPPFHPGLDAGTINNAAGHFSPFYLRLSRNDSEQEITHFSIKLPPGVIGKLAGIPFCSDAAIAAAKARTGPHGGQEELERPSCPQASEIGHTLVGAGVGPSLAYAPGKLYLAGPYHGSNLSLVAITAAKVGPFDLGTVVVRFALRINPETAEVFVDAQGSDPIPHIIQGIPVHLRDIRAYVDRPEFVLNPTSCAKKSTASTVLGSGLDFASAADDQPVTVTSPFQAADCASLGFKPKLALSLKGGTRRGATPKFKAVLTARKGDANIGAAQVTLPRSEFLEQAHIGTVCTRVQFKEGTIPGEKCPAASIYGRARAVTPILSEPLEGSVYLRSSSHKLPDLVAALHNNQVDFALDGRIDSVKNGRIRNTFETVPDAPVSKFVLEMQGGKKGLLVNSTNICRQKNRALSHFVGQNGKVYDTTPLIANDCGGKGKGKKKDRTHR